MKKLLLFIILLCVGTTRGMDSVAIESTSGDLVNISKSAALRSPTIKNILEGQESVEFLLNHHEGATTKNIELIFNIISSPALREDLFTKKSPPKPEEMLFLVNAIGNKSEKELAQLILLAQYLDLPILVNAFANERLKKSLTENRNLDNKKLKEEIENIDAITLIQLILFAYESNLTILNDLILFLPSKKINLQTLENTPEITNKALINKIVSMLLPSKVKVRNKTITLHDSSASLSFNQLLQILAYRQGLEKILIETKYEFLSEEIARYLIWHTKEKSVIFRFSTGKLVEWPQTVWQKSTALAHHVQDCAFVNLDDTPLSTNIKICEFIWQLKENKDPSISSKDIHSLLSTYNYLYPQQSNDDINETLLSKIREKVAQYSLSEQQRYVIFNDPSLRPFLFGKMMHFVSDQNVKVPSWELKKNLENAYYVAILSKGKAFVVKKGQETIIPETQCDDTIDQAVWSSCRNFIIVSTIKYLLCYDFDAYKKRCKLIKDGKISYDASNNAIVSIGSHPQAPLIAVGTKQGTVDVYRLFKHPTEVIKLGTETISKGLEPVQFVGWSNNGDYFESKIVTKREVYKDMLQMPNLIENKVVQSWSWKDYLKPAAVVAGLSVVGWGLYTYLVSNTFNQKATGN